MGFNTHHEQTFHVLAVDDSLLDRKLLERLLTLSSYSVTCVESGDKALDYLGLLHDHDINHMPETKVNLIMTHYSMSGMTGYDLLKLVKKSSWKDVPVVVMSAENEPSRISIVLLQALLRNLFHHTPLIQTIQEGRTLSEQIHLLIYEFDTKHIVLIKRDQFVNKLAIIFLTFSGVNRDMSLARPNDQGIPMAFGVFY